jgi:hypothetical protein
MNTFIPQASLLIGIIPALLFLYLSIKGYEGRFKDKLIFLTFIVGIIIGVISAVIELLTNTIGIISIIILFPVLEQFFKTIVLNIGRFQEKQQTTIYGLCLGLGFGSVFTPTAIIMGGFQQIDLAFIAAIIGSWGIILFHGATGVIIGYGVYVHKLKTYLTMAILLGFVITTTIVVTNLFKVSYLQIGLVFYGIVVYWYATKKIMPRILEESQRRKRTQKEIDIKNKK